MTKECTPIEIPKLFVIEKTALKHNTNTIESITSSEFRYGITGPNGLDNSFMDCNDSQDNEGS